MEIGRIVIFDPTNGKPLADLGEMSGDVLPREPIGGLDYIELPFGAYADEFSRAIRWHVDPVTKNPVFDELAPAQPTYEELKIMIEMMAGGII